MLEQLIRFIESDSEAKKAKFVAYVGALCALFVSITPPQIADAKTALSVIQLFWLVLLTLGLTSLFIDFIKFVWKKEQKTNRKYSLPFNFVITIFIGLVLGAVILNLWRYIIYLYPDILGNFFVTFGFPCLVLIGAYSIDIFMTKNERTIPLIIEIFVSSIILGILIGLAGFYIQGLLINKLFYIQWFTIVAPFVFLFFFLTAICLAAYRKQNLFKPFI